MQPCSILLGHKETPPQIEARRNVELGFSHLDGLRYREFMRCRTRSLDRAAPGDIEEFTASHGPGVHDNSRTRSGLGGFSTSARKSAHHKIPCLEIDWAAIWVVDDRFGINHRRIFGFLRFLVDARLRGGSVEWFVVDQDQQMLECCRGLFAGRHRERVLPAERNDPRGHIPFLQCFAIIPRIFRRGLPARDGGLEHDLVGLGVSESRS